jgi:hypothetical protein
MDDREQVERVKIYPEKLKIILIKTNLFAVISKNKL